MSTPTKCANCGKELPREWVSGKPFGPTAVVYAMSAGPVVLCSAKCDHAYLESRGLKSTEAPQ